MGIKETMLALIGITEAEGAMSDHNNQIHETKVAELSSISSEIPFPPYKRHITREMLMKVTVTSPTSREGCASIVNSLKDKNPVIVDFSKAEHSEAHRCFNYLLGATYALGGSVQRISSEIYVFSSDEIEIAVI